MNSQLLRAAAIPLLVLQLLMSVVLLLRGHNLPGGGFIGGLVATSGLALYALAHDTARARVVMRVEPMHFMAWGLLTCLASGIIGSLFGGEFFTAHWLGSFSFPLMGKIGIGTPFFFDCGVYLIVIGVGTRLIFSLMEQGHGPNRAGSA